MSAMDRALEQYTHRWYLFSLWLPKKENSHMCRVGFQLLPLTTPISNCEHGYGLTSVCIQYIYCAVGQFFFKVGQGTYKKNMN
jgi:hypothetical protein